MDWLGIEYALIEDIEWPAAEVNKDDDPRIALGNGGDKCD